MVKIVYDNYSKIPKNLSIDCTIWASIKLWDCPIWGEGKPKIPHPDEKEEWDQLYLPGWFMAMAF